MRTKESGALPGDVEQHVGLDHGHTCRQTDQDCRAQPGGMTPRLAVQADEEAGEQGQQQPRGKIRPGRMKRHVAAKRLKHRLSGR